MVTCTEKKSVYKKLCVRQRIKYLLCFIRHWHEGAGLYGDMYKQSVPIYGRQLACGLCILDCCYIWSSDSDAGTQIELRMTNICVIFLSSANHQSACSLLSGHQNTSYSANSPINLDKSY